MAATCRQAGIHFEMVLLPPGSTLANGTFLLRSEFDEIGDFLTASKIAYTDLSVTVGWNSSLYDKTDHLTAPGSSRLADILLVRTEGVVLEGLLEHLAHRLASPRSRRSRRRIRGPRAVARGRGSLLLRRRGRGRWTVGRDRYRGRDRDRS